MAEQHSAPEQAAAGKSHGGLGGGYKVWGQGRGPRGPWVLGAHLLARQPLSRKQQQPFLPASWEQEGISPLCPLLPLLCPHLHGGPGHTHAAGVDGAFRRHGADLPA